MILRLSVRSSDSFLDVRGCAESGCYCERRRIGAGIRRWDNTGLGDGYLTCLLRDKSGANKHEEQGGTSDTLKVTSG